MSNGTGSSRDILKGFTYVLAHLLRELSLPLSCELTFSLHKISSPAHVGTKPLQLEVEVCQIRSQEHDDVSIDLHLWHRRARKSGAWSIKRVNVLAETIKHLVRKLNGGVCTVLGSWLRLWISWWGVCSSLLCVSPLHLLLNKTINISHHVTQKWRKTWLLRILSASRTSATCIRLRRLSIAGWWRSHNLAKNVVEVWWRSIARAHLNVNAWISTSLSALISTRRWSHQTLQETSQIRWSTTASCHPREAWRHSSHIWWSRPSLWLSLSSVLWPLRLSRRLRSWLLNQMDRVTIFFAIVAQFGIILQELGFEYQPLHVFFNTTFLFDEFAHVLDQNVLWNLQLK